jgi:hypothetical protein
LGITALCHGKESFAIPFSYEDWKYEDELRKTHIQNTFQTAILDCKEATTDLSRKHEHLEQIIPQLSG